MPENEIPEGKENTDDNADNAMSPDQPTFTVLVKIQFPGKP
jgi:hypothetical protein